jgi:hypothetical protein
MTSPRPNTKCYNNGILRVLRTIVEITAHDERRPMFQATYSSEPALAFIIGDDLDLRSDILLDRGKKFGLQLEIIIRGGVIMSSLDEQTQPFEGLDHGSHG